MIAISKEEKDLISERFPSVHIVRTMKQKSKRHHYYCEETRQVMRLLNTLHGNKDTGTKEGTRYPNKQKRKRVSAQLS